jgi:hypothetical protein
MTLLRESEMGASGSVTFANKKEFRNGKLWRSNLMATNLTLKLGKSRSLLVVAKADTESAWWKKVDSATPTSSTPLLQLLQSDKHSMWRVPHLLSKGLFSRVLKRQHP